MDFPRKGDVVSITRLRKGGYTERFFARVTDAEWAEGGLYFGYTPVDPPRGRHGLPRSSCAAWGYETARHVPAPYGAQVEVVSP